MALPIDFYFDFSSPYGYLASTQIDELAERHGRTVRWRPFLLGAAFKATGQSPLTEQPLRGVYHRRDFARSARLLGVPFRLPNPFPFAAVAPSRVFYWLEDRDPVAAKSFARAVFEAAFVEGRAVASAELATELGVSVGVERVPLQTALDDPAVKARLRSETDAALAAGAFGSPFIFVDGEPFWGSDRLGQVDRWLATGGW